MHPDLLFFLMRGAKLSEEQRRVMQWIILVFFLLLILWGLIVIVRYRRIKPRIRKKMEWSRRNDPFWDYDHVVLLAQQTYIKAQLFLNSPAPGKLTFLSPHALARLRQLKRKVRSESDITFSDSCIISFKDKRDDQQDELKVLFRIRNRNYRTEYSEIVSFRRNGSSLHLTEIVKNPTMYMITHALSVVEK